MKVGRPPPDQATRAAILRTLRLSPCGLTAAQIKELAALDKPRSKISYYMRSLERRRLVKAALCGRSSSHGRFTIFWELVDA